MYLLIALLIIALIAMTGIAFAIWQKKKTVQNLYDNISKENTEKENLLKKEAMIQAKEALHAEREKFDDEVRERRQDLQRAEDKLLKKEDMLEDKIQEAEEKSFQAQKKMDELLEKEDYLADLIAKQIEETEKIAGMSREEARHMLLEQLKQDLQQEQMQLIRENEAKIRESAKELAQDILSTTMQRCAIDQVVESTVSVVNLPSDEMKGRIIGREGRNIRTLETLTELSMTHPRP